MKLSKDFTKYIPILLILIISYIIITFTFDKINENNAIEITNKFLTNVGNNKPKDEANLFYDNAVLIATVSQIKRTKQDIEKYFDYFANLPNIHVIEKDFNIIKVSNNVYINNAFVKLSWDNLVEPVIARMTFIIKGNCILQLHSSGLPDFNENLYKISGRS